MLVRTQTASNTWDSGWRSTGIIAPAAALLVAVLLGVLVGGRVPIPELASMPSVALLVGLLSLVVIPILAVRMQLAVGVFFVWLVLEDLIRKLAGNDIRVYFVKDLLFATVVLSVFIAMKGRAPWREATGRARIFLSAMICWAVIMSVPTGLVDWRLPVIGLRLDFMYLPLSAVGFVLARDARQFPKWLGALTLLAGLSSAVGIAQAVIGPDFLSPGVSTPGLIHLVLFRGLDAQSVYRPTGTFVDPGRFASMCLIGIALGLSALSANSGRFRPFIVGATVTSAVALWISGSRAAFVAALLMLLVALIAPTFAKKELSLTRSAVAGGSLIVAICVLGVFQPTLFSTRADWYRATLDPGSRENEWAFRFQAYGANTLSGIALGGLIGQGTGKESLGKQYIYGGAQQSPFGLYQIEGGYAAVAVEWGLIGLALWVLWTSVWVGRLWKCIMAIRGSPLAASSLLLFAWIVYFLFIGFVAGMQGYQNYLANAYFWLLSGMVFALPRAIDHGDFDRLADESLSRKALASV